MATFNDLVTEVRESLRGYGLIREQVAFLTAPINASTLTIPVDDASGIQPGIVEIDGESIYGRAAADTPLPAAPDGRG